MSCRYSRHCMLIGPRLLQLVLCGSDMRYTRTAEAYIANIKHRILSCRKRSLRPI